MSAATLRINCLFSHKCNYVAHEIGSRLKAGLHIYGIDLQIDPFNVGDHVETRMQTFDIETLIFLSSPESVASAPCQVELKSAERQGIPIFVIHLEGALPNELRKRSYWKLPPLDSSVFDLGVGELAKSIHSRVAFTRQIRALGADNYFHEMINVARTIATEVDRTILAEFAYQLARKYSDVPDPTTRFWIALALGKADTPQAAKLLDELPKQDHPLALEGIRQAQEMTRHHVLAPEPQLLKGD
jgi:hypothetical protein